ncbi:MULTISPECIES: TlpA disulfide reductase family protein [unclassified Myroides]|uniref:TlpA family protein disulfide reductase n=1 Tax=unclassified Myroides TaxID=2642485 RepID=UPI0015FDEDB4|nr:MULTISPECIES: TlpA disulfide reductase family protein [unclassified Myroides]MBB1150304.1 TlpA family protein disulfide reductase [Myroides sp. NP-2]MDM1408026.1 TlpA family protein disulfide reductase [Myroides sp. DF42-4-2]
MKLQQKIKHSIWGIALAITLGLGSQTQLFAQQNSAPKVNTTTTDAVFLDATGKKVSLSSLQGKVVFVNFWATWCPPCIKEMPSIEALKNKMKGKDVVFLLVDVDGKYDKAKAFMDKRNLDLPVYTPAASISSTYLGSSIPTTVIFDKKGNMIQRIVGGVDFASEEVEKFMEQVLKL